MEIFTLLFVAWTDFRLNSPRPGRTAFIVPDG